MACMMRECPNPECGHADTKHPSQAAAWCPHCGAILEVSFDEEGQHNDHGVDPVDVPMDDPQ